MSDPILPALPTAEEVRLESRLTPEQVSRGYDVTALEADILTRIDEQANEVARRIMDAAHPLPWPWTAPAWVTSTTYYLDQVVSLSTSSFYRCILEHTADSGNAPGTGGAWAIYWVSVRPPLQEAFPNYTTEQAAAVQTRENNTARLVVKLLTLASLYRTAGQGNEYYAQKADDYRKRAEELMHGQVAQLGTLMEKGLLGEIRWIASQQSASVTTSTRLTTVHTGRGPYRYPDPVAVPGRLGIGYPYPGAGSAGGVVGGALNGTLSGFDDGDPYGPQDPYSPRIN